MNFIFLSLILIAGLLMRGFYLTEGCIWLDEAYHMTQSSLPYIKLFQYARFDGTPPFPLIFYKFWSQLLDRSILSYEIPAVLFGVLSIGFIYKLGSYLFNKKVGLISAFILTLSTFHLFYSQEIKGYSMGFFSSLLFAYSFYRFLETRQKRDWIFCLLTTFLFMNMNYLALVIVFALFVFAIVTHLKDRDMLVKLFFSGMILLVAYIPNLKNLYHQYFVHYGFVWVGKPTWAAAGEVFWAFHSKSIFLAILYVSLILFSATALRNRTEDRKKLLYVFCWLAIPGFIYWAASLVGKSFFYYRYYIFLLAPYVLLLAYSITKLATNRLKTSLFVFIIFMGSIPPVHSYYQGRIQSTTDKIMYQQIKDQYQEGDVVMHASKYSLIPSLVYHENQLTEYFIEGADSSLAIRVYMQDRKLQVPLKDLEGYKRLWICDLKGNPQSVLDTDRSFIERKKPRLIYQGYDGRLALFDLQSA